MRFILILLGFSSRRLITHNRRSEGNVTVSIVRASGDADLTASPTSLTFTTANWNVAQNVTISAAQDADTLNGTASFTVSAAGLTSVNVSATESDDDLLNRAPTVRSISKTVAQNVVLIFSASDFTGAFADPDVGDALQAIQITRLPTHGTLTLGGNAAGTLQPVAGNAQSFFDESYYLSQYADVAQAVQSRALPSGWYHFQQWGAAEGRQPSSLYSESYYLSQYADVANAVSLKVFSTGFDHFVQYGFSEGRQGVPFVGMPPVKVNDVISKDDLGRLTYTPQRGYTGTDSFSWNGSDGKLYAISAAPVNIQIQGLPLPIVSSFDRSGPADQAITFTAADFSGHFTANGGGDLTKIKITQLPSHGTLILGGRGTSLVQPVSGNAASFFDETYYLSRYLDVAAAVQAKTLLSGWDHFQKWGAKEGRQPSYLFSESYYLGQYADVADAVRRGIFSTGFDHFVRHGFGEGRQGAAKPVTVTTALEIRLDQLASLVYSPASGYIGTDSFSWTGANASGYASSPAQVTLTLY